MGFVGLIWGDGGSREGERWLMGIVDFDWVGRVRWLLTLLDFHLFFFYFLPFRLFEMGAGVYPIEYCKIMDSL